MVRPFHDNPEKGVVRQHWDNPLLRYLHDNCKVRYRYLGLPGVDLIDVHLWRDMIDEVIAFEPPGRPPNRRAAIDQLRLNMKTHGIPGIAYFGSFEEVVMLRKDFDGQDYSQTKTITLYNLDFCDEITSKVETREYGKQVWRFEAIRQILRDQAECFQRDGRPRHFIMMLTIRNQSSGVKLHHLLSGPALLAEAKEHRQGCSASNPFEEGSNDPLIGTHTWAIKTVIFNYLLSYFNNPCLSALFFPGVMYNGTPVAVGQGQRRTIIPSPMLHWVVLCRFADPDQASPSCSPSRYLERSCVSVGNENSLLWTPQTGETDGSPHAPNPVAWLQEYGHEVLRGLA
jgi:hypothetical protein